MEGSSWISSLIDAIQKNDASAIQSSLGQLQSKPTLEIQQTARDVMFNNEELAAAISNRFQSFAGGKVDDPLCQLFYEWYQTDKRELKLFVLRFVPVFLGTYLLNFYSPSPQILAGIEAVLVSVYHNECYVVRKGKELMWIPPSLAVGSVYHVPKKERRKTTVSTPAISVNANQLTEQNIKQHNKDKEPQTQERILEPKLPSIEFAASGIRRKERELLVSIALKHFVDHLSFMPSASVQSFCLLTARLCLGGLPPQAMTLQQFVLEAIRDVDPFNARPSHPHYKAPTSSPSPKVSQNTPADTPGTKAQDDDTSSSDDSDAESVDSRPKQTPQEQAPDNNNNNNANNTEVKAEEPLRPILDILLENLSEKSTKTLFANFAETTRVQLAPRVMQNLVEGLTFCLFKRATHIIAYQALHALAIRASYEIATDVLISVNALLHILQKEHTYKDIQPFKSEPESIFTSLEKGL